MSEKRFAVLIGSSRFRNEPKLHPLRCPENDVEGIHEIFSSEKYGAFHETVVLLNEESYTVMRKINKVLKKASKDDLVLIYYSGHGKPDDNGRLHLATVDTEVPELETTSIPAERIRSFISNSLCTKLVMILDCCYAGAVAKDFFKSDLDGQLQVLSQRGRGIYILSAATEFQVAKEKVTDKYSLMTKHIIGGIKGGEVDANEDGFVSVDEVYKYVYGKVVQEGHQEPTRFGKDVRGELFIARSGKTPREKRNRQIRRRLHELAAQDKLPDDIFDKAREVIALEQTKLIGRLHTYDDLLEKLRQNQIGVWQFIREWYKVGAESTPQTIEPPPKEPKEAKPLVAKLKPFEPVKKGQLSVRTVPKDATVNILNIRAKFAQGMELEPGDYNVEVSADGYETERRWIQLGTGAGKRVSFKLKAIEPAYLQPEPDNYAAWNNKGLALYELGRYEEALEAFDKALEIKPDDIISWNAKGLALDNLSRYEEALEAFEKALRIQPDNSDAWNNKGLALYKLGRFERALEACDQALEIQPDNSDAWYTKEAALYKLGRTEEALEAYQKGLEIRKRKRMVTT